MRQYRLLLISLLAVALAGCAGNTIPDPDPTEGSANSNGSASSGGMDDGSMGGGSEMRSDLNAELTMIL